MTAAAAADLFRRPPHAFLDAGVGDMAYRTVGAGPDVLFVHGWPVSGATFRALLPHLVDHVTCHIVDLPGAGSSRFEAGAALTIDSHIQGVRAAIGQLGLNDVSIVGHDSGGMIARHAMAGDPRLRSMGLINTEPTKDLSRRFRSFLSLRHAPGVGSVMGWLFGNARLRRNKFVLGDAFADAALLDGEFDEFFLQPFHADKKIRDAAIAVLRSFEPRFIHELASSHQQIQVPVQLVWGDRDPFFPVAQAHAMVATFPNAELTVIPGAGLFSHEEDPVAVAHALLPTLVGAQAGDVAHTE